MVVREIGANVVTADTAVVTTAETVAVASGAVTATKDQIEVVVIAWAQLTTGAGTTAVTPRIRRGATAAGTALGDAVAEEVKAAAGSDEFFFRIAREERANIASVEYNLTLEQAGATGNGSILSAGIIVLTG